MGETARRGAGDATNPPPVRGVRRVIASAPLRLVLGATLALLLALWLTHGLRLESSPDPDPAAAASVSRHADPRGEQAIAVLEVAELSPASVAVVEHVTDRVSGLGQWEDVRSVTNTDVVVKDGALHTGATPAFGSRSAVDLDLGLRVLWTGRSRTGAADLIAPDGRTFLVVATPRPGADLDVATDAFRDAVVTEVASSGSRVTARFAGSAFERSAELDRARVELLGLALLAVCVPVVVVLVLFRRRVSATATLLAAGGCVLLLAVVLGAAASGGRGLGSGLPADHPVAVATRLVDERLHGSVPVELELVGTPGVFRRPDLLARVDAISSWLEDTDDVHTSGLPGVLRDSAGVITGVDSVPPDEHDVATLLDEASTYDGGTFLRTYVSDDFSTARLVGFMDDTGTDARGQLAARVEYVSGQVLADTGVVSHFTAGARDPRPADDALVRALLVLGFGLVVLGVLSAGAASWAHRTGLDDALAAEEDDAGPHRSLFARDHSAEGVGHAARGG